MEGPDGDQRFTMAEPISTEQEHSSAYLLDKENRSESPEQNQTLQAPRTILNPLQESQICNLARNAQESAKESEPLGAKRTKGSTWLLNHGKKSAEKAMSSPGIKKKKNVPQGARTKSAGKGHQSNVRKSMAQETQDLENPRVVEETPRNGESTEKEVKTVPMETKGSFSVSYIWNNKGVECDSTGLNTPIIDFAKETRRKANSPPAKKPRYLLVCCRELKAIVNPWVPCGALKEGEILELELRAMKSPDSSNEEGGDKIMAPDKCKYQTFHGGLFFKVKCQGKTKGGKEVKIIGMRQYYSDNNPMAVFGFPDQTITQALHNDKRFTIPGQISLEDSDGKKYNSDVLLKDLVSDTYTIVVHKRDQSKKRSLKKALAKKDLPNNEEGSTSTPAGTSDPSTGTSDSPTGTSDPPDEPCVNPPDQPVSVSSRLSFKFSRDYKKVARTIGQDTLESELVNGYKKNVLYKDPMMATTFRQLYHYLDNVAFLRYHIEDKIKTGTLFLLTESLALTCYHVVKLLIQSRAVSNVEVIFNYESEENIVYGKYKKVEWSNKKLDCAFIRVEISPSPPGLLEHIAPPPQDGAVCVIGHPDQEPKQIDLNCSVIAFSQRAEAIADTIFSNRSYIHVLTQHNFMRMNDPTLMTYDSCMYWGASGAPVFNDHGELVAMHTGGYPVSTPLKKKSVIEYGRSAVDLIIHGAIHLEELRVLLRKLVKEKENLLQYLKPGGHPVQMQPHVRQLYKVWEESDSQKVQSPGVNVGDLSDSPMDTI